MTTHCLFREGRQKSCCSASKREGEKREETSFTLWASWCRLLPQSSMSSSSAVTAHNLIDTKEPMRAATRSCEAIIRSFPGRVVTVTVLSRGDRKRPLSFDSCAPASVKRPHLDANTATVTLRTNVPCPSLLCRSWCGPSAIAMPLIVAEESSSTHGIVS
jgi:hypothetical protein